jgi:hypothetical protein
MLRAICHFAFCPMGHFKICILNYKVFLLNKLYYHRICQITKK